LSEQVTQIKPDENQRQSTADQNWINLASLHHIPSEREGSYLEKIVQAADHLASAEREQGNFYEQGINKKTRLESLLGRISIGETVRKNDCFLPLSQTRLSEEAVYPKHASLIGMEEKSSEKGKAKAWLSQNSLVKDYKNIAEKFVDELQGLQTFQSGVTKEKVLKCELRANTQMIPKKHCCS